MGAGICYNCFSPIMNPAEPCPHCGYRASDNAEFPLALSPGSILGGRYILGRVLGQGGFGITYVAQDDQTKERVAIKEFFPETMATRTGSHGVTAFAGTRQENFSYGIQCFLSEAQTLAQFIGMENIVRVHSYFEENGTAYFAMDYVDGISFQSYLRQQGGRIDWLEARSILLPVMDALSIVHSKGIIHRDISPDNIYITYDGTVKLLDFGAARYSLGDRSRSLDVVLKAGYAPMEQYTRRGRQGSYTDVYSMAATFYFAITGHLPPESVERMEEDELVLPSSYGVRLPIEVEDALEKALSVRAADRYQTMEEFRAALLAAGSESIPVKPPEHTKTENTQKTASTAKTASTTNTDTTQTQSSTIHTFVDVHTVIEKAEDVTVVTPVPFWKRYQVGIVIALLILIPLLGLAGLFGYRSSQYSKAQSAMLRKDYDTAYAIFQKLDDYKDSEDMADAALYQSAMTLMDSGDYEEASLRFIQLGNYKDSRSMAKEASYQKAHRMLDDQNYSAAYEAFSDLDGYSDSRLQAQRAAMFSGGKSIATGLSHSVALQEDGTVIASGATFDDRCAVEDWRDIVAVAAGDEHTIGLKADGTVIMTGRDPSEVAHWSDIVAIDADNEHSVGLRSDGTVVAAGNTLGGRCDVEGWTNIVEVSAGYDYTAGLKEDGSIIVTGTRFDDLDEALWSDLVAISAGHAHLVGLKADGTVVADGWNKYGQCDVSGWRNIVAIFSGFNYVIGLKDDGTLVCAGDNESGQCNVSSWRDIVSVAPNFNHTIALKADGTVVSTGDNGCNKCEVYDWSNIRTPG